MSREVMRYRLEHNTPAREVQPGRDINLLRGTVMVTEADYGNAIDDLLSALELAADKAAPYCTDAEWQQIVSALRKARGEQV
jgi:hypothetical protein